MSHQQHRRSKPSNCTSKLLNDYENQQLSKIIGNRCMSLATAVAQVVQADPPGRNKWNIKCTGVVCFVKDNPMRTYFIRVYDIRTQGKIYEQEIYNQLKYNKQRQFFHTFEGDNCVTGLNFANEDEANMFYGAIHEKLMLRRQRRDERRKQASVRSDGTRARVASPMANTGISAPNIPTVSASAAKAAPKKKEKETKKNKKSKITKDQIGTPTDFRHVGHVGWDPDKGFDMDNLDPSLKNLFDAAGLSAHELQDKETATFIYDFIEQHGGVEALKREATMKPKPQSQPPPLPQAAPMAPPPAMNHHMGNAPPPPPPAMNRGAGRSGPPPLPPSRAPVSAPPPPPPSRGRGMAAPPPPPPSRINAPPPMAPQGGAPPPPPPPPPAMGGGGPPAPPPPPPPGIGGAPLPPPPPENDDRGALLSQIRGGSHLKHIDPSEKEPAAPSDGRSALMDAIRGGIKLSKVDQAEIDNRRSVDQPEQAGLAGALARALADRAKVVQGDDDDDNNDEEDDDDDDWSD